MFAQMNDKHFFTQSLLYILQIYFIKYAWHTSENVKSTQYCKQEDVSYLALHLPFV